MIHYITQIEDYLAGPQLLRHLVEGMTEEDLDATPIPGKWSTRQVVSHIADFESIYADRMKRVIAEHEPTLLSGNPDWFASRLGYHKRHIEEELQLIEAVRNQMARIFRNISNHDFLRIGYHSEDGPLTLERLLQSIIDHIPHHVRFVVEKRKAIKLTEEVFN